MRVAKSRRRARKHASGVVGDKTSPPPFQRVGASAAFSHPPPISHTHPFPPIVPRTLPPRTCDHADGPFENLVALWIVAPALRGTPLPASLLRRPISCASSAFLEIIQRIPDRGEQPREVCAQGPPGLCRRRRGRQPGGRLGRRKRLGVRPPSPLQDPRGGSKSAREQPCGGQRSCPLRVGAAVGQGRQGRDRQAGRRRGIERPQRPDGILSGLAERGGLERLRGGVVGGWVGGGLARALRCRRAPLAQGRAPAAASPPPLPPRIRLSPFRTWREWDALNGAPRTPRLVALKVRAVPSRLECGRRLEIATGPASRSGEAPARAAARAAASRAPSAPWRAGLLRRKTSIPLSPARAARAGGPRTRSSRPALGARALGRSGPAARALWWAPGRACGLRTRGRAARHIPHAPPPARPHVESWRVTGLRNVRGGSSARAGARRGRGSWSAQSPSLS